MTFIFKERIFLCCLLAGTLTAKSPGDDQVWQGVNAFYNYKTDEAIHILTEARLKYPENPAVHLTWAAAHWLHGQANYSVEETYRILEENLKEVIPIYKNLVGKYPNIPEYRLYLGSAIGLQARVHLGKKEWFKTLKAAYQGFVIIRKVAREHPEIVDAQLPIGIVEFYASLSNIIIQWAVELFGLDATRESGMNKIELAANQGEFSWIEAKSIISFIFLWVNPNPEEALLHSKTLINNFPDNFYFNILYVESLTMTGQNENSFGQLQLLEEKLPQLTPIQQKWYRGYLSYEWGLYYFYNNQYQAAMKYLDESIADYNAELDVILANAYLLKGKLHDLKSERAEAVIAYRTCIDLENNLNAMTKAKKYLQIPFTQ